ncbi:hypothetical protein RSAG8_08980, partial [Rhizoctonia solani AG-8 WAC10335]
MTHYTRAEHNRRPRTPDLSGKSNHKHAGCRDLRSIYPLGRVDISTTITSKPDISPRAMTSPDQASQEQTHHAHYSIRVT